MSLCFVVQVHMLLNPQNYSVAILKFSCLNFHISNTSSFGIYSYVSMPFVS